MEKREGCLLVFGYGGRQASVLMLPHAHAVMPENEAAELIRVLKTERKTRRELNLRKKELKVV